MTREVELRISGLHMDGGEENANVESFTRAEYFKRSDSHYLLYEETMEGLEQKTKTRIKFKENRLELVRRGAVSTHMIFEEKKKHRMEYATPYGTFFMGIDTKKILVEEKPDCIRVTVEYGLEMENRPLSDSSIVICVRQRL